jgi:hypothetical protein
VIVDALRYVIANATMVAQGEIMLLLANRTMLDDDHPLVEFREITVLDHAAHWEPVEV